ncbi:MAG: FAD-dependent oxidoreductase [Dehalococcoidia bacterium]|nr:FAD-dependent oxidoreductase [Dehalococcoidia bacterium]
MNMNTRINSIECDVLVVGGGSAGLWAAIRAADFTNRVTLVDKGIVASSGISPLIHFVFAPVPEQDVMPAMQEIVEGATYLTDQVKLEILLREMGDRFREMEAWGVPFERDGSGKLVTQKRMGQKFTTCAFVNGRKMVEKMKERAVRQGVNIVERVMVTDLLTSDGQLPTGGRVTGAVGFHTVTGQRFIFRAKAVVVTTGLIGAKLHILYSDNVTGDGQAMALRAGADLAGMEFGMHPVFSIWARKFSTGGQAEYVRAGAKVVNKLGENIVEKYAPDKKSPFLPRETLCFAAAKETLEGRGPIFIDMRHLDDETLKLMRQVLPSAMKAFDEVGIDLRRDRVETTPFIPYWNGAGDGGVKTGLWGESNVKGLYAAGVAAHSAGTHSFSVLIAQPYAFVSGHRAGEGAAKYTRVIPGEVEINNVQVERLLSEVFAPLRREGGHTPDQAYHALNKVIVPLESSFIKNEERIRATLAEIRRVQHEEIPRLSARDTHGLVKANEVKNFALLAEATFACALVRQESRLCHLREEFPYRDDVNWLQWIVIRLDKKGLGVRMEPVPLDKYPIKPKARLVLPVAIQLNARKTSAA